MAFQPKKIVHRKVRKGRSKGLEVRGTDLSFGSYGLKALEPKKITDKQMEAARRAIVRYLRRGGKMWIRVFPHTPITKKAAEVPMGGGTGSIDHYAFPLRPGRIIFEIDGISEADAREALRKAGTKLSTKTRFITK